MTSAHRLALLHQLTRQVAYRFWVERGRPAGSPEVDWFQAEILVESVSILETFDIALSLHSACHEMSDASVMLDTVRSFVRQHREGISL
jgi:Protein of unknown function (DUF2934)